MSNELLEPQKWVERYADMMYRYSLVRVRDSEAAEELVQSVFFAALKSQNSFAGKSTEKNMVVRNFEAQNHGFFQKL